jgi:hypothetical protein
MDVTEVRPGFDCLSSVMTEALCCRSATSTPPSWRRSESSFVAIEAGAPAVVGVNGR